MCLNRSALDATVVNAWALAQHSQGSRAVQAAIDAGTAKDKEAILLQLRQHVAEACRSKHANFVLQRCIQMLPAEKMAFVLDEILAASTATAAGDDAADGGPPGSKLARSQFGCRVIERLLEHCQEVDSLRSRMQQLVGQVLGADAAETAALCCHQFGNFVAQTLLEHGDGWAKKRITDALLLDVRKIATHRYASHVLEKAMSYCELTDREALANAVLRASSDDLTSKMYGSFVVKVAREVLTRMGRSPPESSPPRPGRRGRRAGASRKTASKPADATGPGLPLAADHVVEVFWVRPAYQR